MSSDLSQLQAILSQLMPNAPANAPADNSIDIPLAEQVLLPSGKYVMYNNEIYRVRGIGDTTMNVLPCSRGEKDAFIAEAMMQLQGQDATASTATTTTDTTATASTADTTTTDTATTTADPVQSPTLATAPDDISMVNTMIMPAIQVN